MLQLLCPQAAAALHIPGIGFANSCDVVRSLPAARPANRMPQRSRSMHEISTRSSEYMKAIRLPLAAAIAAALGLFARVAGAETAITIYSSAQPGAISPEYYRPLPGQGVPNAMSVPGYALVRDDREVKLKPGRSQQSFTDVAALIDPTTVTFTSLTDPATRVLEQNFQFDLVSTQKLLLKFIDRQITVDKSVGNNVTQITGTLLSATDGIVMRDKEGAIYSLPAYSSVKFPDLPGGLNTRPTLVWDIHSPSGGAHKARVTYQTGGVTW